MNTFRWPVLFSTILGLLLFTLYASVTFSGLAAFSIGFIYIAYDSVLLLTMVGSSLMAVREQDRIRRWKKRAHAVKRPGRPSLAMLVCARNERLVLPECLQRLMEQTERADDILILDDGSTDEMVTWLDEQYDLTWSARPEVGPGRVGVSTKWPALRIWCKPNSGKAASLNQGLKLVTCDLVVTLDADTYLEPRSLEALRDGFQEDPELGIAGGVLTPICGRSPLASFFQFYQTYEYARGFLWRLTWMQFDMLVLISGAFCAYRRDVLTHVGGFDTKSWVEDYELTHRIYKKCCDVGGQVRVKTLVDARATTDAPATPMLFLNQRRRWFSGFISTHFQYNDMVGNPKYGNMGKYMMILKTLDLLLPIYALASAAVLVGFLIHGRSFNFFILGIVGMKLLYDLTLHAWSILIYQRWLGIPMGRSLWLWSIFATLSEPFVFQIMRQLGAVLGWIAFLRGNMNWHPQRPTSPAPVTITQPDRQPA